METITAERHSPHELNKIDERHIYQCPVVSSSEAVQMGSDITVTVCVLALRYRLALPVSAPLSEVHGPDQADRWMAPIHNCALLAPTIRSN